MSLDLSNVLDYRGAHAHPHYATLHSAGLDLTANIKYAHELPRGAISRLPTGLWVNLPENGEMQIRSRSGLAFEHGVVVLNSPGTIDADYQHEVMVILINHGPHAYWIQPGDKIAQAVIAPVVRAVQGFTKDTKERTGGFGSTGS